MELKNKKILVIGVAKTGIAAARFLRSKGARVVLTDIKSSEDLKDKLVNVDLENIQLELPGYPDIAGGNYDMLVVSPGVPLTIKPIKDAYDLDLPVLSELELAYQFSNSPIIAITGTNGKTTTTSLIGEIMKQTDHGVLVGGNIGLPLIEEVGKLTNKDVIVAEVSSFQLETTLQFKPKVSVLLNITPDHLDWHGSLENYTKSKAKVLANQNSEDFTVLNYDDPTTAAMSKKARGRVIFFSQRHILKEGVFVSEGKITVALNGKKETVMLKEELYIKGAHNLENALAAVAATWVMGVPVDIIASTLKAFKGVEHRMEFVAEINGVTYVNDSKGTNPDAAIKALDSYENPLVLIAGGKNKGVKFDLFAAKIKEKVRSLVVVGHSANEIKEEVEKIGFKNIISATTFEEAVRLASQEAKSGEVVLLSPACTSWDMFNSYEERGNLFKKIVADIASEAGKKTSLS